MSAGTLTLTNNSAAVSGSGTAFTTELAAGDFIVVTVGGIPYTLPVNTVNSNTSATLVSNFTGPTQSGAAWSAVPRIAMNLVTAALVAQSAEALRGLNYDKQNWQQVFSASGMITVKLPDGSTFPGPSWKYLSDNMATKSGGAVPVNQGGTGATSAEGARKNLELDNVATKSGGAVPVDQGGTGRTDGAAYFAGFTVAGGVYSSYQYRPSQFVSGSGSPLNAIGGLTYLQCAIANDSSVSDVDLIRRRADGSQVGQIIVSFPKNYGTLAVQGTSGRDYKTDITPADNKEALSRVMSLEMVNFVYKDDEQQRLRFGIIAEDAERVAPQYIKHNRVPIEGTEVFDSEGNKTGEEYRDRPSIDNNPIVMDLLGVAQCQQKMINDMAESIKTLESRLT